MIVSSSGAGSMENGDVTSSYSVGPSPPPSITVPSVLINDHQKLLGMGKVVVAAVPSKSQRKFGSNNNNNNINNSRTGEPGRIVNGIVDGFGGGEPLYDKKKAMAKEIKNLDRHDSVVERVQNRFNEEMDKAEDRLRRSFQEVRLLLDDREAHLSAELNRCREDGHRVLIERVNLAKGLHQRVNRVTAMSDREVTELRNQIKLFVAERRYDEELGQTIRFQWEPDTLIEMVKNFGEVIPVKPISALKNSSHSSLVSSVGEDSGLGMISPEGKTTVQVVSGGVEIKSDALTTDQLEQINQRLQQSMRDQGIDTSVLKDVGGLTSMPNSRRPKGIEVGSRRGFRGATRGGTRSGKARGTSYQAATGNKPLVLHPKLSIMQD